MPECKGRIRLWLQADHCVALVDKDSNHLIQNVFKDSEVQQHAISSSASEKEIDSEAGKKGESIKQEVTELYKKFMRQNNLDEVTGIPLPRSNGTRSQDNQKEEKTTLIPIFDKSQKVLSEESQ